jgi:hypothetical protein
MSYDKHIYYQDNTEIEENKTAEIDGDGTDTLGR